MKGLITRVKKKGVIEGKNGLFTFRGKRLATVTPFSHQYGLERLPRSGPCRSVMPYHVAIRHPRSVADLGGFGRTPVFASNLP